MKIVLVTFITIFLISCSTSNIEYDNQNSLKIVMDSQTVVEAVVNRVYDNRVNLSNINIYQNVFILDSSTVLIYEHIKIAAGYKLHYGMNRTIGIAFRNYNYELIDSKANIQFYKLSNNRETIYMISENINKQGLKILYTTNQQLFEKIKKVLLNITPPLNLQNIGTPFYIINGSQYIKSNWNIKNIIFDNIISKVGGRNVLR